MAQSSNMLPLGTVAPAFALPDVTSGDRVSIEDFSDRDALLVMFICRHCPYVAHVRPGLAQLARDYADRSLGIVAISSNDPGTYPEDAPESLAEEAAEAGYSFPYLYDESQDVARAYSAACTPDFFVFDGERKLVYRGQFDSTRPRTGEQATGEDLRAALDAVLAGEPVDPNQKPSVGCGIKWRSAS